METQQEQKSAVEKLILDFAAAFNATDISKTVASFTNDGINMTNNGPAVLGTANLTKAFGSLFNMAKIHIDYQVDEISVNKETAFARTNSKVNTTIKASGDQLFLENKELFILRRENGKWKITHYIFNNTKTTQSSI